MSFSRPNQWYHSHADPIWPDGTFQATQNLQTGMLRPYKKQIFCHPIYFPFPHSLSPPPPPPSFSRQYSDQLSHSGLLISRPHFFTNKE